MMEAAAPPRAGSASPLTSTAVDHGEPDYTACYCEENVYRLIQRLHRLQGTHLSQLYAVFISNAARCVPIWEQRASSARSGFIVWDYHCICLQSCPGPAGAAPASQPASAAAAAAAGQPWVGPAQGSDTAVVWDLDTRLPFPCGIREYAARALQSSGPALDAEFARHGGGGAAA